MTTASRRSNSRLDTLRKEAADCRACPLWKDATQTVFGEGPQHAQVMLVGEQPGDKEDLAGKPFVGPVAAMGATAAQSVFGKITPINKTRGRLIDLDDGIKALVTVHPSYLLRLPDADARAREYQRFVEDLKIAAELLRKSARAA